VAPKTQKIERIITPMPRRLLERIEDFRYAQRIPTRAQAIRRLIEAGLKWHADAAQS
jgi:metal-responsive CopG/Arc/MetJ family transcriptional regulator